jgi:hypothetical protein
MRTLFGKFILGSCFAILATSIGSVMAQTTDPAMGTWKLNLAKSKYTPGPAPKSLTVRFEPADKGVKTTSDIVSADGAISKNVYTANYDGKDYPIEGSAIADTVSIKKVDAKTVKRVDKKAGKEVQTFERVLSADGKTMTIKHKGKNAKGEIVNNLLVLDRQ